MNAPSKARLHAHETGSSPSAARRAELPIADMPAALALVDATGHIIEANQAFRAVLAEIAYPAEDMRSALRTLATASGSQGLVQHVVRLGERELTLRATPPVPGTAATPVCACLSDIAPSARAPAEQTCALFWACDRYGRVVSISDNGYDLFSGGAATAVGRPLSEVFRRADGHRLEATPGLATRSPITDVRVVLDDAGGRRRWISLSGVPRFDTDGRYQGHVGTGAEVTRLVQLERELAELHRQHARHAEDLARKNAELEVALAAVRRSDALKEQFLRNMNHEFHTPLNAIIGNAEVLSLGDQASRPDNVREKADRIACAGRTLLALFNDAVEMASIQAGTPEIRPQLCRAATIINPELALAQQWASAACIDDRGIGEPPDTDLLVDPVITARILRAIVDNAVKFTPPGGRIGVQFAIDRGAGVFTVAIWDTGNGIAPDMRERIFEPFQRTYSDELTASAAGQGLGLAVARAYARIQGGDLQLEKSGPRGSRFKLGLPLPPLS